MARYVLDAGSRRADRNVLIGGSPLRIFRLSDAGVGVLEAIETSARLPAGHQALTDRLLDAGAIHPRPDPLTPTTFTADSVTVVVPAYQGTPDAVVRAAQGAGISAIIVVDDGSTPPLQIDGARCIRLDTNRGPGAARNAGLALVTTPFVAFVDTDAEPDHDWLDRLLWLFDDERVGLVAPRVRSRGGNTVIDRYEQWRSPLDLGMQPAQVRSGSRVSYVPAAAIVVRTAAIRAIGGFDESLRFGEDVDLVWRLDEAGWRCRYEPTASVTHDTRPTLPAWIRQRINYGSAAAPLDRRHPGALAPTRTSRWSALIWALVAIGQPEAAFAVCAGTIAALSRKLDHLQHPVSESFRLAGRGNLFSGRLYASAITRSWWPIVIVASVLSSRVRRIMVAAAIAPTLNDWIKQRPPISVPVAVALRLADDMSYGGGVWLGMARERRIGPIVPAFPELTPPAVARALRRWFRRAGRRPVASRAQR